MYLYLPRYRRNGFACFIDVEETLKKISPFADENILKSKDVY